MLLLLLLLQLHVVVAAAAAAQAYMCWGDLQLQCHLETCCPAATLTIFNGRMVVAAFTFVERTGKDSRPNDPNTPPSIALMSSQATSRPSSGGIKVMSDTRQALQVQFHETQQAPSQLLAAPPRGSNAIVSSVDAAAVRSTANRLPQPVTYWSATHMCYSVAQAASCAAATHPSTTDAPARR